MVGSVSVVRSRAHWADWELRLAAVAQHHKRMSYCITLAREKIKVQNLKYGFS